MQVRARAFSTGKLPGVPLSQSYIQISSNAAAFTSDLPLVIVHNFGAGAFPGSGDQTAMVAFFESRRTNRPQFPHQQTPNDLARRRQPARLEHAGLSEGQPRGRAVG
jgi:hypothetical protein